MSDFKIGDKVKCNCVDDWEESKGYESLTIVADHHGGSHLKYDGREGLICMCFVEDWPEDFNLVHEESLVLEQHPLESYPNKDALSVQVGGGHYKGFKIQPVEYIYANNIPFLEGNVIKYTSRHRDKNKATDIKKAIHCLELILKLEYPGEV